MMFDVNIPRISDLLERQHLTMTTFADGAGVLINLAGGEVLVLNCSGMLIINEIRAGASSLEGLSRALAREFDIDEITAEQDAAEFLQQLESSLSDTPAR